MDKARIVVVGGGPGGYTAAFYAADLGMDTVLIDTEPAPGGVCVWRGCIPSKALLHAAHTVALAREAEAYGVKFAEPTIDLAALRAWKDRVVGKLTGGTAQLAKLRKIRSVQGRATLLGPNKLEVKKVDGTTDTLEFEHCVLATGSRPVRLPFLPDSPKVWDSSAALELREIPKRLVVLGGGYIGMEMATVYGTLGSEVTVVEMTPGLLPGCDRDLVVPLAKRAEKLCRGGVLLDTKITAVKDEGGILKVTMENKDGAQTREFDALLYSVGRKPNSDSIGLDKTKVQTNKNGFIQVDLARRTAEPSIFAIGDVAGQPMLAHKASHEGRTAVDAASGKKAAFEPQAIPAVVFTDPEIATCGLSETQAAVEGKVVEVARFSWGASGRSQTLGRTDGMTKLVIDPATERVLGVGIVGPGAGELIAEGTLAVEMGARASDLALTIHAHPTLSETVMEAAEMFFGHCTHAYRPKKPAAPAPAKP
ncbi:MAG: dihydrolipoyl dehydrogenase [Elusimicrobia bacterium]|nr:dihydrolipoyl dehydrogenase [Elusimicrobiota bacterium]